MKKYIKYLIIAIVVFLAITTFYFQVIKPMSVKNVECKYINNSLEQISIIKDSINNGNINSSSVCIYNEELPSQDTEDYTELYISPNVQNRSAFSIRDSKLFLEKADKFSDRIILVNSEASITKCSYNRFEQSSTPISIIFYSKGMTEEDIKEMVLGVKLKLIYESEILGTKQVSFEINDMTLEKMDL